MKRLLLFAAAALWLGACATSARVETATPTVVQPNSPPAMEPAQVRGTYQTTNAGSVLTEGGGEAEEAAPVPSSAPIIGDVPCYWPLRGQDPNRRYIKHMACPERPNLPLQPGYAWFEATKDRWMQSGYKCARASGTIDAWVPAGAHVQFPLAADLQNPELGQTGYECGCGNTAVDLHPDMSAWRLISPVTRPQAEHRRIRYRKELASAAGLEVQTKSPLSQGKNWVQFAGQVRNLGGLPVSPTCWYRYNNWNIGAVAEITPADLAKTAGEQRVMDVDGDFVPLAPAYSEQMPYNQTVAYEAVCQAGGQLYLGNIVWNSLSSPSFCESHSGLCRGLAWGGGLVGGALVSTLLYREFNPYHPPRSNMPCYGSCFPSNQIQRPPGWQGDPGTQPQPGPGPTWPGGTPPSTTPPPTTTPPPSTNPGPTWPGGGH